MEVSLTLTAEQRERLCRHLYPGDGKEAVAFILCNRAAGKDRHRLVAHSLFLLPHARCDRARDRVAWSAEDLIPTLEEAERSRLSVVKIHSHPGGYGGFSRIDDESDAELLPTIRSWVEHDVIHGSSIMLPDGRIFGRYIGRDKKLRPLSHVNIVGPDLQFYWDEKQLDVRGDEASAGESQDQAFGEGTTHRLSKLKVGVVGTSGTGSPTAEQLLRLGVGTIVAVDDDVVENRNLNRILFATRKHAERAEKKVQALKEDVDRKDLGTRLIAIPSTTSDPVVIRELATCDIIFGCVDSVEGRFHLNLVSSYYLVPYFDVGVLIDAVQEGEGRGSIRDVLGTVHYVIPGGSSLISRDAFSLKDVSDETIHRNDPAAARQQVEDKYIKGLQVRRPAVVSVNMFASALAVNDLLARLHPYRKVDNKDVASIEFSLAEIRLTADEEMAACPIFQPFLALGDQCPLLGLPELAE